MTGDNYSVGVYLRLSQEDDRDGQSESIGNQRELVTRYAAEQGWSVVDVYIDDGFSGLNFDRPDFRRLVRDIERGWINLVITKDLSRLGRDYIDTGYYLERYFPKMNVRYIALNDGIDTFAVGGNNDMSPFKAVINDMYAKDISKKVRTALLAKKLKGEFIGSVAPYGYAKDAADKRRLVADSETAPIVRRIFAMFIAEGTKLGIANALTREGVPTPSQSKNLTATQRRNKGVWNAQIIGRILTNPTYIGNLTQNRSRKINYKLKSKVNLPADDWITVEGTHEPLVTAEEFAAAARLIETRNYVKRGNARAHLLSGLCKCGDCGGGMTFVNESPTRTYMVCSTWRKHAKLGLCTAHTIREERVEDSLRRSLRELAGSLSAAGILSAAEQANGRADECERETAVCRSRLAQVKAVIASLYRDKVSGVITEEEFAELSDRFRAERDGLSERLRLAEERAAREERVGAATLADLLEEFLTFENVDRATLATLVDKIEVFRDKRIRIHYSFAV
ncbi:MAG: recombinase family protein [Oscillospiraceae bacterium]|jgi:DNA invertase Pin-like site-specific DNA recombinase|nr:recombinase family protein [Oscillospiraceae bacterium]